jgi:hypothetical protein
MINDQEKLIACPFLLEAELPRGNQPTIGVIMNIIKVVSVLALIGLVSGCAATALSSKKMADVEGGISKVDVVFIPNEMKIGGIGLLGRSYKGDKQSIGNGKEFGDALATQLPQTFSKNGITAQVKNLTTSVPEGTDLRTLINDAQGNVPILSIRPSAGEVTCSAPSVGCSTKYEVQADLIDKTTGHKIWVAVIDSPYPMTFGSGHAGPATSLSEFIIELWRKEALLAVKQ